MGIILQNGWFRFKGNFAILLLNLTPLDVMLTKGRLLKIVSKVREVSVYTDSWGEISEICINVRGGKCNLP